MALTAPVAGQDLTSGAIQSVSWDAIAGATKYILKYSLDGGASWTKEGVVTDAVSYDWVVPFVKEQQEGLLRVVGKDAKGNVTGSTSSAAPFYIQPPMIYFVRPYDALSGDDLRLCWSAINNASEYSLAYSVDNGTSWTNWATVNEQSPDASINQTDACYSGLAPVVTKAHVDSCQMKVVAKAADGAKIGKMISTTPFSISPPRPVWIFNLIPQGYSYQTVTLNWQTPQTAASVIFEYSLDDGKSWQELATITDFFTPSIAWDLPDVQKTVNCQLKATARDVGGNLLSKDKIAFDLYPIWSFAFFPDGTSGSPGDRMNFSWHLPNAVDIVSVKLKYGVNPKIKYKLTPIGNGDYEREEIWIWDWHTIETIDDGRTMFDWTVPMLPKDPDGWMHYVMVATDSEGNTYTTSEDENYPDFPIAKGQATLTSPSAATRWVGGTPQQISWATNASVADLSRVGVVKAKLKFSKNGGATWESVATLTDPAQLSGPYSWELPFVSKEKANCKFKIILKNADGETVGKATSEPFTLLPWTHVDGRALLGLLSGAEVQAYSVSDLSTSVKSTSTVDHLANPAQAGTFSLALPAENETQWFLVKASGGQDVDADNDGLLDGSPTQNNGFLHTLLRLTDIQNNTVNLNPVTDLFYRLVEREQALTDMAAADLSARLNTLSAELLNDVNADGVVNYADALAFVPSRDSALYKGDWAALQDQLVAGIHNNLPREELGLQAEVLYRLATDPPSEEQDRVTLVQSGEGTVDFLQSHDLDGNSNLDTVLFASEDSALKVRGGVTSEESNFTIYRGGHEILIRFPNVTDVLLGKVLSAEDLGNLQANALPTATYDQTDDAAIITIPKVLQELYSNGQIEILVDGQPLAGTEVTVIQDDPVFKVPLVLNPSSLETGVFKFDGSYFDAEEYSNGYVYNIEKRADLTDKRLEFANELLLYFNLWSGGNTGKDMVGSMSKVNKLKSFVVSAVSEWAMASIRDYIEENERSTVTSAVRLLCDDGKIYGDGDVVDSGQYCAPVVMFNMEPNPANGMSNNILSLSVASKYSGGVFDVSSLPLVAALRSDEDYERTRFVIPNFQVCMTPHKPNDDHLKFGVAVRDGTAGPNFGESKSVYGSQDIDITIKGSNSCPASSVDGIFTEGEWDGAPSVSTPDYNFHFYVKNENLYLLIDQYTDTSNNTNYSGNDFDTFTVHLDESTDGVLDPGEFVCRVCGQETLGFSVVDAGGGLAACSSSDGAFKYGFGSTPGYADDHRFFEIVIPLNEAFNPMPPMPYGTRVNVNGDTQYGTFLPFTEESYPINQ